MAGFGGAGLPGCDPASAADDARKIKPTDEAGINSQTKGDHRVEVKHHVQHTEGINWLEVKGAKGETRIGIFLELVIGLKHTVVAGVKTVIDASLSKTFNIGPYSTEMAAAKYEILAKKVEKITGTKGDTYAGYKYEKVKGGAWTEKTAGDKKKEQALEKLICDTMAERVGPLLEATAARFKARGEVVNQKIGSLDMKIASELRVKCGEARMAVAELTRHLSNIQFQCGKFERKCNAMDETVGSLMEIKGSSTASKASAMKVKAGLLKFTGSMVKLGE